jgi:CheY-like chemotaxis protein
VSDTSLDTVPTPTAIRPPRRALRVLVVEDEESVRSLLSLNLELAGYLVVGEAGDGAEGLSMMTTLRPDVVVLDMMMFPVSGSDFLRSMASTPKREHPTVVAFSAAPRELENALDLGADAAVLKDGDFDALLDVLDALPG